jgi:hypothetical protein
MHHFSNFLVAKLLHLTQDKGGTQICRKQAKELFDNHLILNGATLVRLRLIEFDELGSLQPEPVHAKPHADSIDKSGECAVVAKLSDLAECLQERFLRNVLSLVSIPKKVGRRPNKPVAVPSDQTGQSRLVTRTAAANPLSFLRGYFGGY